MSGFEPQVPGDNITYTATTTAAVLNVISKPNEFNLLRGLLTPFVREQPVRRFGEVSEFTDDGATDDQLCFRSKSNREPTPASESCNLCIHVLNRSV